MRRIFLVSIIFLLSFSILLAEETKYTDYSFARLNFMMGNVYIQKASDLAYEEAEQNMPITAGDRLGTTDGRAEFFLGNGNYIRIDTDTKIDILSLPNKSKDLVQVKIWAGHVYFSIDSLEKEKSFEIHTDDVSLYFLERGLYRVDVNENSETEILVFNGVIEAAGENGSVLVKDEQRLEAIDGKFTLRPTSFTTITDDSFDRWSEQRESMVRKQMAEQYLPEELGDYEAELDAYGEWTYTPEYGHVWIPGGRDSNWRPYYHGRWMWIPLAGWTWLPYEPWGWVTSHYGRWHWNVGYGWYWIPMSHWGPAWVGWHWGYDYWGWAPLSYWGYPGVVINNIYNGKYTGDYPYNSRALTVIHKNQLKAKNVSKVALDQNSLKTMEKINLTKAAPNIRPSKSSLSIEKLEGNKILLRRNEKDQINNSQGIDPKFNQSLSTRNILRRSPTYPSSPVISRSKTTSSSRYIKSRSKLSRFYDYISKGSSRYSKSSSRSSQRSLPKGIISKGSSSNRSSVSKSPSRPPARSSSSSRSSSGSKSSSSKKVKKK